MGRRLTIILKRCDEMEIDSTGLRDVSMYHVRLLRGRLNFAITTSVTQYFTGMVIDIMYTKCACSNRFEYGSDVDEGAS